MTEPDPSRGAHGIDSAPEGGSRPVRRVWTVVIAFAALGLGQVLLGAAAVGIAISAGWLPSDPVELRVALAALTQLPGPFTLAVTINGSLSAAIALAAAAMSPTAWRRRLRLAPTPRPRLMIMALGSVGFLALSQTLGSLQGLLLPEVATSLADIEAAVLAASPAQLVVIGLSAGLLAGVGEEFFFRGYVQTRMVARFGRWPGIVIAAAAFGLVHQDWVHSPMTFCMGLFVGWLADRCGSIWPAVAAHVVNNLFWIVSVRLFGTTSATVEVAMLFVGATALIAAVFGIERLTRRRLVAPPALDGFEGV